MLKNLRPNHSTPLFVLISFNATQHLCDRELELSSNSCHYMIVPHVVELEGEQMHAKNVQEKVSKCFCAHPGLVMC